MEIRQKAIRDFKKGHRLADIAVRYNVTIGTVSLWARNGGAKQRQRGCRHKDRPRSYDMEIVAAVKEAMRQGRNGQSYEEIGARFNLTRAGVHRIYHKWKDWKGEPPFAKGDRVRFNNVDYLVLKAGPFDGTVQDIQTGAKKKIPWRIGDNYAVKL